jgi:hypothetical protein
VRIFYLGEETTPLGEFSFYREPPVIREAGLRVYS